MEIGNRTISRNTLTTTFQRISCLRNWKDSALVGFAMNFVLPLDSFAFYYCAYVVSIIFSYTFIYYIRLV